LSLALFFISHRDPSGPPPTNSYKYLTFIPGGGSARYKCVGLTFVPSGVTTLYKCGLRKFSSASLLPCTPSDIYSLSLPGLSLLLSISSSDPLPSLISLLSHLFSLFSQARAGAVCGHGRGDRWARNSTAVWCEGPVGAKPHGSRAARWARSPADLGRHRGLAGAGRRGSRVLQGDAEAGCRGGARASGWRPVAFL
jgi:hypothetical protein